MQGTHEGVFRQIGQWLGSGSAVWLCTVIRTYGSAPRPVGSLMAFNTGGGVIGSVSGGCIEEALFNELASGALLQRAERANGPWRIRYGQTQEDQRHFSLPCGGQLHLLLEHLTPDTESCKHFLTLATHLQKRQSVIREVCLFTGARRLQMQPAMDSRHDDLRGNDRNSNDIVTLTAGVTFSGTHFTHTLTPGDQLLLVGLGEVARYAAQFATAVDFAVTLCDMREDFMRHYPVSGFPVLHALPDELIAERFHDEHSAIMTLSHDPKIDDLALLEALQTRAFFIGAMGSEQTSRSRRERLASLGITAAQLGRLHAPVGIPIGSKTPPEIALSAVTQLTGIRNRLRHCAAGVRLAQGYDEACSAEAIR